MSESRNERVLDAHCSLAFGRESALNFGGDSHYDRYNKRYDGRNLDLRGDCARQWTRSGSNRVSA